MNPLTAALLGLSTVVLALAPPLFLATASPRPRRTTALRIAIAAAFEMLLLCVAPWAFATVYGREIAVGVFVVGAGVGIARSTRARARDPGWPLASLGLLAALVGLDARALSASFYSEPPVEARLPFGAGTWCVVAGGSSKLTNPFHGKAREVAALDIVKLAPWGNRATRLVARSLDDYASFGAPVSSPCDGEVIAAEASLPDNPLGAPDDDHPSGNHVVIRCPGGLVKMAHLQQASLLVAIGAGVVAGQPVARIGNSGGTSEPHLHLAAFPSDLPMDLVLAHSGDRPLRLDGRFLVTNTVLTID